MFWKAQITFSVFVLLLTSACGIYVHDSGDESPVSRPPLPLRAPDNLLGSWKQCNQGVGPLSSGAIYTFNANGSLVFESLAFITQDCHDQGTVTFAMNGSFVVGSGNTLDLTIGDLGKAGTSTVYRVYSVKGDSLLISNNPIVGGDQNNRDYSIDDNALDLTRVDVN